MKVAQRRGVAKDGHRLVQMLQFAEVGVAPQAQRRAQQADDGRTPRPVQAAPPFMPGKLAHRTQVGAEGEDQVVGHDLAPAASAAKAASSVSEP